ncbi:hypothetical protein DY000_02013940 [Brassica cretica]|uniref:Uncharacterized protein n=1 Tax=Brassica cretica TaxID=69181 RepID=A0ABQ7CN96_BRACR|nr:hypothetical protein DY000_02013940 [Brassica cretica]
MKPPKRVVLKTLEVDAGSWKESPINLQRSVMVAISWTRGQRFSVVRLLTTLHSETERRSSTSTMEQNHRGDRLDQDNEAGTSGERTPLNLEAPHKERRTKGGQLGLETRTTSNSPPTVTGDRESPTTARENKIHGSARLKEVKK